MVEGILVILPAYNEEKNIRKLLNRISDVFPIQNVLIVDDGSNDRTAEIAEEKGANVIKHKVNLGKGMALNTGFKYAIDNNYRAVITMDSDLQHNPDEIPLFVKRYRKRKGILIIGTRSHNLDEMPFLRFLVNHTTSLVASILSGVRIHDSQSGYRLFDIEILKNITVKTHRFQAETEIIVKAVRKGFKLMELPIEILYRRESKSYINPIIDTIRFIILSLRLLWR